jgi:thioredoxin-related protein
VLLVLSFAYLIYINKRSIARIFKATPYSESFDNYETSNGSKHVLFIFSLAGCHFCDKIKGEVSKLQNMVTQDNDFGKAVDVRVVAFPTQSSEETQLAKDFNVQGFPAIVLSKTDKSKFWIYHGTSERTAQAIRDWALNLVS